MLDKPLLALAILTILVYLFDLLRGLGDWRTTWLGFSLLIDGIFVVDLLLKLRVYGMSYVQTPWFMIDLISCLPLIDAIAIGVKPIRAVRFVRGFRILRILRGLRILRALRSIPAFDQFVKDASAGQKEKAVHHSMNLGLIGMTVTVLLFIVLSRKHMENNFIARIDSEVKGNVSSATLKALGGSLTLPGSDDRFFSRELVIDGQHQTAYFDMEPVEERSDEVEFFVILGMMTSMLFLMYIIAYHQLDVTQTQLRGLLNLALPKQVSERFLIDPHSYVQKSRMPATILFMDFVGFTKTCEGLAHDPDRLSAHLEAAMDRLVNEIVKYDLIIDKFIGDAVMSFRGGPLVNGEPADHAYRSVRAALASTRALAELDDPYFHRVKIGGASGNDCLIGAFGTSARLSYTILGDAVNLAARLEPASGQCGTKNLFCEHTIMLCTGRSDLAWRRWGRIRVAGKAAPVNVYEAFDLDTEGDTSFISTFQRALDAFERNDFDLARDLFLLADSQRPGGDEPSRLYVPRCERLLLGGPPAGWEPVLNIHK
ncbi:adenylate/guanylate cyclase domain-containing protein [Singulisphaera sp. GP187]|uniref:adenylate/guanylate cyclase domain-containing protein n=1 Tax=Singulisphaera sp. GP187 TaxID=1882752 RepID=UPI001356595B|nr:adenylate/guanylate cyclase domain-containing protein [Singulisphaera sp. GP187]